MIPFRNLFPALLSSAALFAQAQAQTQAPAPPFTPRPEFEVASVKPSAPSDNVKVNIGVKVDGAQVHYTYFSLQDYLRLAYKVKAFQISGPDFLASARFDIDAKLPSGATREQVPEMLQSLLAERFEVKLHHEAKEFPVYGLIVAKAGLKIQPVAQTPEDILAESKKTTEVSATGSAQGTMVNYGNGAYFSFSNNKIEVRKLTMANLADMLARFVDQPVVDLTDLPGKYDFTINLTDEDYTTMMIRVALSAGVQLPPQALKLLEGASDQSLYAGLRAQGLTLEKRRAPLDTLIIDHSLKSPTAQ